MKMLLQKMATRIAEWITAEPREYWWEYQCEYAEAAVKLEKSKAKTLKVLDQVDGYLAPEGDEEDSWHEIRKVLQDEMERLDDKR
jgi:hypothetical protein